MKEFVEESYEEGREKLPTTIIRFEGIIVEDCFEDYENVSFEDIPDEPMGNGNPQYQTNSVVSAFANIVIYTEIEDITPVKRWLDEKKIKYHAINTSPFSKNERADYKTDTDTVIGDKSELYMGEEAEDTRFGPEEFHWQLVANESMQCKCEGRVSEVVADRIDGVSEADIADEIPFYREWLFKIKNSDYYVVVHDLGNCNYSFSDIMTEEDIDELVENFS